jgi:hypothetical protein
MTDLVVWLRQQIDKDEVAWEMVAAHDVVAMLHGEPLAPRMLAEVAAKRAILGMLSSIVPAKETNPIKSEDAVALADWTLRLLAQPYAGRPGWREEWAT